MKSSPSNIHHKTHNLPQPSMRHRWDTFLAALLYPGWQPKPWMVDYLVSSGSGDRRVRDLSCLSPFAIVYGEGSIWKFDYSGFVVTRPRVGENNNKTWVGEFCETLGIPDWLISDYLQGDNTQSSELYNLVFNQVHKKVYELVVVDLSGDEVEKHSFTQIVDLETSYRILNVAYEGKPNCVYLKICDAPRVCTLQPGQN